MPSITFLKLSLRLCLMGLLLSIVPSSYAAKTDPQAPHIKLWEATPPVAAKEGGQETYEDGRARNVREPEMIAYRLDGTEKRPAVVIFPGGGYGHLAVEKEGEAAARWANAQGMHAFIVKYRLYQFGAPAPVMDAQQAMRVVRQHANDWNVDAEALGIVGFSAGGHVAASLSQHYDYNFFEEITADAPADASKIPSARPDFAILVYPVITLEDPYTHSGSRKGLLGEKPSRAAIDFYSLEKQVDENSPPTFIIHSSADPIVPIENSLQYWQALRAAKVPTEFIAYQFGGHGFGLEAINHHTARWPDRAADWLKANGFLSD